MIDTKDKNKKQTIPNKPQKFFFDQNNFDDDYVEEIEEEEPPPPMFSQDELEGARTTSYERGKKDGLAEAKASREQHVAKIIESIDKNFRTLFAAEQAREDQYEGEAIALSLSIFRKLFPALNSRHGLAEIEELITTVLQRQREEKEIIVAVHPDYVASIQETIDNMVKAQHIEGKITIDGNDALGPADCRLSWKSGGAQRHTDALAEEIHKEIQHILADKPTLDDNREINDAPDTTERDNGEPTTNGEDE